MFSISITLTCWSIVAVSKSFFNTCICYCCYFNLILNILKFFRKLPGLCVPPSSIYNCLPIVYAEFSWILLLQCVIILWHYSLKFCLVLSCEVADADSSIKTLEKEADRLLDKIKPIKELQDNLGKNISQIKELINQARKQANSVSLLSH